MTHSHENKKPTYDSAMASATAAIMVMDHIPDADEVSELAQIHLDDFPSDEAHASCEIVYEPPSWLDVHEQDQMSAFLRDGAACILVIYMQEGALESADDDDWDDD